MNFFFIDGCLYSQKDDGYMKLIAKAFSPEEVYKLSMEAARELSEVIDEELLTEFRKRFESINNE